MSGVLIAEDNILIADILEDFLLAGGYEVCGIARTVAEAVKLADLHKPELAVFDFRLADGGYGSQIRRHLKDKAIGILYATGDGLQNDLTDADGEACIEKPYRMSDVLQALHIIQDIRKRAYVSPSVFPKNFHLLGPVASHVRKSA